MNKKELIAGISFCMIVAFECFVYTKMEGSGKKLPRCFPTGQMFPFQDRNGNIKFDSVYHTIADFKLTDQNGQIFTNHLLKDKVYVANFFFATCPSICPIMTSKMYQLQEEFKDQEMVAFLSHTIDPEHDSVRVLKEYEVRNKIDGHRWHLLTGKRKELYDLSKNSYYLGVENDSPDNFEHSEKFVLVDQDRVIRGYYDGTMDSEIERLKQDLKILLEEVKKEKVPTIKSNIKKWKIS